MKACFFYEIILYVNKVDCFERRFTMENRPVGRQRRVVQGGEGIKRSGNGLGKETSQRGVQRNNDKAANSVIRGILGGLFGKKR